MKIVTYNIWNSDANFQTRMEMLISLLKRESIDIAALQEVRDEAIVRKIAAESDLDHYCWKEYPERREGLAILSRYPLMDMIFNWTENRETKNNRILSARINTGETSLRVTNVHLDWEKAFNRESGIIKAVQMAESETSEHSIILGDFNSYPESSVYWYMTGRCSLFGESTAWIDTADLFSRLNGVECEITMDYFNNPRWREDHLLDIPGRFDWIMIRYPYPKISDVRVIGKEPQDGITISDHYGVLCEIAL